MKVLVIDDESGVRRTLSMILEDEGYTVLTASDGEEGLERAGKEEPDLILCDIRMPRMDGLEFLEEYRQANGQALVIAITAYGSNELAVEAMKKGAYDYLPKPFTADEVVLTLKKAEEREKLRKEVTRLRQRVTADQRYPEIVAKSAGMRDALELATKVAQHPSTVLVTGESGTGKELIARLIHNASPRAEAPFVPINCGAIPENLLESELFGHVKGAFTGAHTDRAGLFEEASGGTLSSSTRSASCPRSSRSSSSAPCRKARSAGWATAPHARSMSGSSPPPPGTWSRRSRRGTSGPISTTGSTWSGSTCRPCGSGARTSRRWPVISSGS